MNASTASDNGDEVTATVDYCELTLFVSGASDLSARAIANARALCDTYLAGRYRLCVVDVHDSTAASLTTSGVLATPTLIKISPPPLRRCVGDLSHTDKVLLALDLPLVKAALATHIAAPDAPNAAHGSRWNINLVAQRQTPGSVRSAVPAVE